MKQQKPNVLFFPFGLLAHYLRCIELAKSYRFQYNVIFKNCSPYDHFLTSEEIPVFSCADFDTGYVMDCTRRFRFSWLNERDLENIFLDQVRCITEYRPEFVVGDMSPTLKMAAEYTNTPLVSVINGYMSKYYELQRPVTSTHPAAFLGRVIPSRIFQLILEKQERKAFTHIHKPFRKLRSRYQLKNTDYYLDELEGDNTLICDDHQIFPQRTLPLSYKVIGPLLYAPGPDGVPAEVTHAATKRILVSFGSSGDWENVACLNDQQFAGFSIFTAGDALQMLKASHITPLQFSDLDKLLPHIDLLICHGGNGTLNYAHRHKVPFIAVPSIMEQEWNALRFCEIARGSIITKRVSAKALYALITGMLNGVCIDRI